MMLSFRQSRARGQAQTEYILIVALTLFVAMLAVNGVNLGAVDTGGNYGSDVSVDTSGMNIPTTNVFTIPGLKDAMFIYEDRLFRWVSEKEPRESFAFISHYFF